jgi:hypothetical protein
VNEDAAMSAFSPTIATVEIVDTPRRTGVFRRLFNALIESRMRAADQQVRRYMVLHGLDQTAEAAASRIRLSEAGERLPFNA